MPNLSRNFRDRYLKLNKKCSAFIEQFQRQIGIINLPHSVRDNQQALDKMFRRTRGSSAFKTRCFTPGY